MSRKDFVIKYNVLYESVEKNVFEKHKTEHDNVIKFLLEEQDIQFYIKLLELSKPQFKEIFQNFENCNPDNIIDEALDKICTDAHLYIDVQYINFPDVVQYLWEHPDIEEFCTINGLRKDFDKFKDIMNEIPLLPLNNLLERSKEFIRSGILDSLNFDLAKHVEEYLANFTAKPIHSQADSIGVFLNKPKSSKKMPYICANTLMQHGEYIYFDQIKFDNKKIYQAWLKKYNQAQNNDSILPEKDKEIVLSCFNKIKEKSGTMRELGYNNIDYKLKQLILPNPNNENEYIGLIPLFSPGECRIIYEKFPNNDDDQKWIISKQHNDILPLGGGKYQNVCSKGNYEYTKKPFLAYVPNKNISQSRIWRFLFVGSDNFSFKIDNKKINEFHNKWLFKQREQIDTVNNPDNKNGLSKRGLSDELGVLAQKSESSFLREIVNDFILDVKLISNEIENLFYESNSFLEEKGFVQNGQWSDEYLSKLNKFDIYIIIGEWDADTLDLMSQKLFELISQKLSSSKKMDDMTIVDKERMKNTIPNLIKEIL